jgi:hypothetical protein
MMMMMMMMMMTTMIALHIAHTTRTHAFDPSRPGTNFRSKRQTLTLWSSCSGPTPSSKHARVASLNRNRFTCGHASIPMNTQTPPQSSLCCLRRWTTRAHADAHTRVRVYTDCSVCMRASTRVYAPLHGTSRCIHAARAATRRQHKGTTCAGTATNMRQRCRHTLRVTRCTCGEGGKERTLEGVGEGEGGDCGRRRPSPTSAHFTVSCSAPDTPHSSGHMSHIMSHVTQDGTYHT